MTLGDMIEKVSTRTKRPDKRDQIIDAINNAISFFSLGASFGQDLAEATINIDSTEFAQSFSITTNLARFRRIKYLKRTLAKGYLSKIDPHRVFDKQGCEKVDSWYRAGDNIVIKLARLSATLEAGWYQYPALLEDDADTHWMLDVVPLMVFNKAAAEIFDSIGEPADAKAHEKRANDMYIIAKEDFEDGGTEANGD